MSGPKNRICRRARSADLLAWLSMAKDQQDSLRLPQYLRARQTAIRQMSGAFNKTRISESVPTLPPGLA